MKKIISHLIVLKYFKGLFRLTGSHLIVKTIISILELILTSYNLIEKQKTCSTCNVHTIGRQSFLLPRKEEVDLDLIKYV